MARQRPKVLLTKLELEVMRSFWEGGIEAELTVREVVERMHAERPTAERQADSRRKPLAYNTVQTVLNILRDKGVLKTRAGASRAHLYQPRVSREQVTTSMVGELVKRLFDGQVEPLLLNLVERESLSRAELEKLRQLIDDRLDDQPVAGTEDAGGAGR